MTEKRTFMVESTRRVRGQTVTTVLSSEAPSVNILLLTGWRQNPQLQRKALPHLHHAIPHARITAFNAFDALWPANSKEVTVHPSLTEGDELLEAIPKRMVARAIGLHRMNKRLATLTGYMPDVVVAHCAASNTMLTTRYMEQTGRLDGETIPAKGLLVEPMIAEGRRAVSLGKENGEHEQLVAADPDRYIGIQSLAHVGASGEAAKGGMADAAPVGDILKSKGVLLLAENAARGADFGVLLGENDVAAPADMIEKQLAEYGLSSIIQHYPEQARLGHGYLVDSPQFAMQAVAEHLLAS